MIGIELDIGQPVEVRLLVDAAPGPVVREDQRRRRVLRVVPRQVHLVVATRRGLVPLGGAVADVRGQTATC